MTSVDRISPLLDRFRVRTRVFHTGPLCGVTTFDAQPGRAFLHVVRRGDLTVTHAGADGARQQVRVDRPTMLFYPRPWRHTFRNSSAPDSDFACATVDFEAGEDHPLVRTLPPVLLVPLADLDGLGTALDLLFAEIDNVRCGRRLLADRLFEVVLILLYRWILDHAEALALPPGLLTGLSDEQLAPALVAIQDDPGRAWTLATMAREAAMSRSVFAARFRAQVGQPPAEYLAQWRLVVARDRLRAGAAVAVVATELGYANPSAFSRAFTQRTGQSPRAWLRTEQDRRAGTAAVPAR